MKIFQSQDELIQEITSILPTGKIFVVGIDGKDGSGKSTLAKQIAGEIGAALLSLDEYVEKGKGNYVQHLRTEQIRQAIAACTRPIVVEGVCLLAALENVGLQLDKLIYMKRMDQHGFWLDEEECGTTEPVEPLIEKMAEDLRAFGEFEKSIEGTADGSVGQLNLPELTIEIVYYHAQYKPQEHADYVFHRFESHD